MIRRTAALVLLLGVIAACSGADGSSGQPKASRSAVAAAPVTVVAAGDIATDPGAGRRTADLIASVRPDAVLALGDNAYRNGSLTEYERKYDPTWGEFKDITRPVPGNHEYGTDEAAGYFEYFAEQVRGRKYYAWNAGAWRMYALNCEIDCGSGSPQLSWLTKDLSQHPRRPALAYVHQPRFTCSTKHGPNPEVSAVWTALQEARGRIMLAGHNHAYERFAEQDSSGKSDPDGLQQFVVGTGGAPLYPLEQSCPNRLAAHDDTDGVLVLTLRSDGYTWRFLAVGGRVLDEGRGRV